MKKIILSVILFFILAVPVLSQEPVVIFLPLILKDNNMPTIVEKWKVISPVESTNYVMNPSAETTGNFTALGGATVTRVTTYQKYGLYSYRVQTGSNGQGVSLTLSTLPNENCFATARIRGKLPIRLRFIIGNGIKTPNLIEKIDANWSLYGVEFAAAECNGRTELRIIQQGNGIGDFYVDGAQVENLEYWTSYIDGDQEGCNWNGPEHASTSSRSGLSGAGGRVKDLYKDYGFFVDKVVGAGAISRDLSIDEYALLPGGELNEIKIHPRNWSLVGKFIASSEGELYQNRQDLLKLLRKNSQKEPIKFLFYHPLGIREIKSFYTGGLEGDQSVFYNSWVTDDDDKWAQLNKYIEKAAIQLKSPDPYFYLQGENAATLDNTDTGTARIIMARLKSTGQWSTLGPPNVAGTYTDIRAIAEDATYIYIGGDFLNFDNIAAADYIVRYNKITGAYSALDVGLNGVVYALALNSAGVLYIGGAFTNAGGVAAADYICTWNGTNFAAVGVPLTGAAAITNVQALAFDHAGILYVGGSFTDWNNIANADYVVKWDGSAYTALSTGANNIVRAFAIGFDNTVYVGGHFTTPQSRIASWNGTAFAALGAGMDNNVYALAIHPQRGSLIAGGAFTSPASYIASWNGTAWEALSSGMDGNVFGVAYGQDGLLFASGDFVTAGGILVDRFAKWNDSVWGHLDLDVPGVPSGYVIFPSKNADPLIKQNYSLYFGYSTSGTASFAGKTTVNNSSNLDVFPKVIFEFASGISPVVIETVRNETSGKELLLDYTLLSGERLTVDLNPTKKSVVSNYFGSRLDAILGGSDFGDWVLLPDNNSITCFVSDSGAGSVTYLLWRTRYESYE